MGCGGFRSGGVPKALVDGKQDANALLTAIAGLAPTVADRMIYTTGVNAVNTTTLTSFARGLLDDADAATARGTLGLGSGDTPTFAGVTLVEGTNSGSIGMTSGGEVELANPNGAFNAVTEAGGTFESTVPLGTWRFEVNLIQEMEVRSGGVDVSGDLTAGLLSRTPVLPPWDDSVNPVLTAADTGGVFKFTGTATLPDASTLPEGWEVTLIFNAASCASNGGNIISPDGNFNSTAVYENGSGRAVLRLICDGSNYIAASQTGTILDV